MSDPLAWLRPLDPPAAALLDGAYDKARPASVSALPAPRLLTTRRLRRHLRGATATTLRCVSTVSADGWRHLQRYGWVGPEPAHTESDFRSAYDWMRWRMTAFVSGYGGRFPMWLWPSMNHKASPEVEGYMEPTDVVLVVDVPLARVLISDFDEWHAVINGWRVSETTCPACGTVLCAEHYEADDPPLEVRSLSHRLWTARDAQTVRTVTQNWDAIFDARRHGRTVLQATTEFVEAGWLVAAFTASVAVRVKAAAGLGPRRRTDPRSST